LESQLQIPASNKIARIMNPGFVLFKLGLFRAATITVKSITFRVTIVSSLSFIVLLTYLRLFSFTMGRKNRLLSDRE